MKPIWVIQTNAVSRLQAEAVASAVKQCGGAALEVTVNAATEEIDFIGAEEPPMPNIPNLIPYGSTAFINLAMGMLWSGVFRNSNFSVPVWNEKRSDMLNHDSVTMLAKDIPAHVKSLPSDALIFIRPMVGKKLFAGQTATVADVCNWLKTGLAGRYRFTPDTEVAIAPAKTILAETRWFVVNGQVIDGSTYRLRGQRVTMHDNNENHLKEAQRFADVWLPHPTCVMDLAETDEGTRVIEFNTFNSSGFYHHDIPKIIKAVHDQFPE